MNRVRVASERGCRPAGSAPLQRCRRAPFREIIYIFRCMAMVGLICSTAACIGQELQAAAEQSLEQQAASEEVEDMEDDGQWQQWEYLARHRLNLNQADEPALLHLLKLSPLQAAQFLLYRKRFGEFVDIMELQAVPGLDVETIRRILPYVQVTVESQALPLLRERVRKGEHQLLLRGGAGWDIMPPGATERKDDGHAGGRAALLLRYTYRFRNLLQWGFTMEKDAGEQLFPGGRTSVMDFHTAHVAVRQLGHIRALVLGDFHVNLGQGLIHWQSMAFRKGASGILVHRQGERIRAYNGTDENRFHRGLALDLGIKRIGLALFAAADRMDGNIEPADTTGNEYLIRSMQWSGLHRTPSEQAGRNAFLQTFLGGSAYWNNGRWKFAWNLTGYRFNQAMGKGEEPYRRNGITGKRWMNQSVDYGGTFRNIYVFGEIARAGNGSTGIMQGMMVSIDPKMDMAFLFRYLPTRYHALQANAFTEQSAPGNETGFYAAVNLRPATPWLINAWVDLFRFPWLRYRVHRPSYGREIQCNVTWKPNRQLEITQRFMSGLREINPPATARMLPEPQTRMQHQYRIQVSVHPNRFIHIRQRVDLNRVRLPGSTQRGFLVSVDLAAQLPKRPVSVSARVSWFQADSYEARLYQLERDVLYYYAISPFYRQGLRTYLLLEARFFRQWTVWLKASSTLYDDNQYFTGSLADADPVAKAAIRCQVMYIF